MPKDKGSENAPDYRIGAGWKKLMLKTFIRLLGDDAPVFRRYAWMAVVYGVLCGLTIITLVPVLTHLLDGDVQRTVPWLTVLLAGLVICWVLRRYVEKAGVRVGLAILQGARHRLGDHVAHLPVGWFTPVIAGVVTPLVLVVALFLLHWTLGLIALVALPLLTGVLVLTGRLSRRADDAFHGHFAAASQRVVEFAQAQSVLRAFNGEGAARDGWNRLSKSGGNQNAADLPFGGIDRTQHLGLAVGVCCLARTQYEDDTVECLLVGHAEPPALSLPDRSPGSFPSARVKDALFRLAPGGA